MTARTLQDYLSIALAFINAKSSGRLTTPSELSGEFLKRIGEFAEAHKIRVELVEASDEHVRHCAWMGALLGASAGYVIANLPGAVAGGVIGYCAGGFAARVRISIATTPTGHHVFRISST